jgi:hypothetical protein
MLRGFEGMTVPAASNFSFLKVHDEQLVRLGRLAERYFPEDPNTCLLKLRQLSELLAQIVRNIMENDSPDLDFGEILTVKHGIPPCTSSNRKSAVLSRTLV